ncbi:4'-phosphopantetheinyl transferase family protein [Streptomyces sp. NPDC051217]|uniref:4'-phosphopantetheinyl transferase family protein n=1 Tax=Streptomyces sp. NPDC051217 TaxID=3365644 RepID=UPI00379E60C5
MNARRTGSAVPEGSGPIAAPMAEDGRLDLWLLRLPKHDRIAGSLDRSELSAAERGRGAAFVRPADSVLYLSAHIALRRVLASYLGIHPRDVVFFREPCPGCGGPHGRPAVRPVLSPGVLSAEPPLHFSLSHSSGVALMGVAGTPVGVDVERHPREETAEVCARALHTDERAELAALPQEARPDGFGRIWTRKEAYLKGLGTGLGREPSLDYLGSDTGRRPEGWTILDVPCGPRHHGAAALLGTGPVSASVRRLPMNSLLLGGAVESDDGPDAQSSAA